MTGQVIFFCTEAAESRLSACTLAYDVSVSKLHWVMAAQAVYAGALHCLLGVI